MSEAHLRLQSAHIENLPWQKVVDKYDRPHSLFYMDPPYWATEGYGVEFGLEQYDQMAELARSIAGSMVISVNDHPEMRRAFDGLHMETLGITYTVGGGDGSEAQELLIWNQNAEDGPKQPATLALF